MATCAERYDEDEPRDQATHTCDLDAGHEPPHHCPRCGNTWRPKGWFLEATS